MAIFFVVCISDVLCPYPLVMNTMCYILHGL